MVAQARIIAKGQAQFAWGLGGPVGAWAYKGERRFKKEGPKKNLRAVLGYPFGQFQWLTLADSGVMSVKDLKENIEARPPAPPRRMRATSSPRMA